VRRACRVAEVRTRKVCSGEIQQLEIAPGVAVRQRRDVAVGPMAVHRELARPLQPLVEPVRQNQVEAPGIFPHSDQRPEHDVVVVGRSFALHAVGEDVALHVGVEAIDGKVQQFTVGVEAGQRQRDDEQPVQFERAVITLGRQVSAKVAHLLANARLDGESDGWVEAAEIFRGSEPVPGINPVLDSAADHIGRIEGDRNLIDPRGDEPLERLLVAEITGLLARPTEIEAVVELAPLQAPLLVGWQRRMHPVGLDTKFQRDVIDGESARGDLVGDRQAAVHVVDHAEHRTRGGDGHTRAPDGMMRRQRL
jgi:hypothetical protein